MSFSRGVTILCNSWIIILLFFILEEQYVQGQAKLFKYCRNSQFECYDSYRCIERDKFCDGIHDCKDMDCSFRYGAKKDCRSSSDEMFCRYVPTCPITPYRMVKCKTQGMCIPKAWWCDGHRDCFDGSDEADCHRNVVEKVEGASLAQQRALQWLLNQRKNDHQRHTDEYGKWGAHVPRIATSLYLANSSFFTPGNTTGEEIVYELKIRLLQELLRNDTKPMSPNELALYVQAMVVTCLDPRYFQKKNLVEILRHSVTQSSYTNPFVLLTLCSANDEMTETDVLKLKQVLNEVHGPSWTDTQTFALMALTCIKKKRNLAYYVNWAGIPSKLKALQKNGTIQSLPTTALVLQALFAAGEEEDYYTDKDWELEEVIKYLISSQSPDGSYGNLLNMYRILPTLYYKSFANVSSSHCQFNDSKIQIRYTLKFGENTNLTRSIELKVLANTTFFDIIKMAKVVDLRYRFKNGTRQNSKPYIYEISGIQDDPEQDMFWTLYKLDKYRRKMTPVKSSPADVIPTDNEEYIMWYRSGSYRLGN